MGNIFIWTDTNNKLRNMKIADSQFKNLHNW